MPYSDNNIASGAFVVVPSNSTDLPVFAKGVYVGGAGDLKVTMVEQSLPITFSGVVAGTFLPIAVRRVWSDSTATLILGLS